MIGRIKIGQKTERGYPQSLDYFKLEGVIPLFTKLAIDAYGEKPNALPITINSISTGKLMKDKAKLIAIGDDNYVRVFKEDKTLIVSPSEYDNFWDKMEEKYNAKWCQWLKIECILPKIGVTGAWRFTTTGENVIIPNIINDLSLANGDTSGLWLLSVYKTQSNGKQFPIVNLNKITNQDVL